MSAAITAALLCDQVRQENNGKYIVVGVYSSSIVVSLFPTLIHLQVFARADIDGPGQHKLQIKVLVGGVENQRVDGELEVPKASSDWLAVPLQPIQFHVPTTLSIEQMDDKGEWSEFFRISVDRPSTA